MARPMELVNDRLSAWWMEPAWDAKPVWEWEGKIQPKPLGRARVAGTHAYLLKADEDYRRELQILWRTIGQMRRPIEGDLAVTMMFSGRDHSRDVLGRRRHLKRPDLSNLIKAVEDAGNGVLWEDDQQIRVAWGAIVRWSPQAEPWIALKVWRLA